MSYQPKVGDKVVEKHGIVAPFQFGKEYGTVASISGGYACYVTWHKGFGELLYSNEELLLAEDPNELLKEIL